jgi:hypothetical protein
MKVNERRSRWRDEDSVFGNFTKNEFFDNFSNPLRYYEKVQRLASEPGSFIVK